MADEYSYEYKAYRDSMYAILYPNVLIMNTFGQYSTTKKFNCHGYAWHITDGGSHRWIGFNGPTIEYDYWLKGSYTEVPTECFPGKVSYSDGDHSAITTNESGIYISKWRDGVLAKHNWDDSPYGNTNLKFYKLNFSVLGPLKICNSGPEVYSLSNTPGGSILWSNSSNLQVNGSNTGQNISVSPSASAGYVGRISYQWVWYKLYNTILNHFIS